VPAVRGAVTSPRLRALAFAALLGLLLAAFHFAGPPPTVPSPLISPSIEVYFSRPDPAGAPALRAGPESALLQALDGATRSVDMAIYDLDLMDVRDALLRAWRRGVEVRLVLESDNLGTAAVHDLVAAGVPLVADRRPALMHDKFTVIDGREVWTGSMNYTVNDAYFNDNNLVRLIDAGAASAYRDEFEEMFGEARFGELSLAGPSAQRLAQPGAAVEVYFAPEDGVSQRVVALIGEARAEVTFLAFSLTSDDIVTALAGKAAEGVPVRGVMDAGQARSLGSRFEELRQAGVDVRLDGNPDRMHHKVIVIDGQTVLTGSYNFSRSAETQNDENLVVLHDEAVAAKFLEEFERVFSLASP